MNNSRDAREFCFQFFFHLQLPVFNQLRHQLSEQEGSDYLKKNIEEFKDTTSIEIKNEDISYVINQISSTLINYNKIEETISKYLKNWKLNRISKVDYTNLLLSTNEIMFSHDPVFKIIINEAIEISKKYGTNDTSGFINGILDNIAKNEH